MKPIRLLFILLLSLMLVFTAGKPVEELQTEQRCFSTPQERDNKYRESLAAKKDCFIMDNDSYERLECGGDCIYFCYKIAYYGPVN